MNIRLLDPSLYCRAGHQADWNLRLAREMQARGHSVQIHAHAQLDASTLAALGAQVPTFATFRLVPYLVPDLLQSPATAPLHLLDAEARPLARFIDGARLIAEDLAGLASADLHIWTTFNSHQLHAVAQAPARVRTVGCIHEPPTLYDPVIGAQCWRYAWLKARDAGVSLRLGVTVAELLPAFQPLFDDAPLAVWPFCADGHPPDMRRMQPRRIGFFGGQREEKGGALIQQLVPALLQRGHEVVLHDSGDAIAAQAVPGLTVLGHVDDLAAEIARCDLVVAPYDPRTCAMRGSGITWESLASGVPIVVPANTAAANLVLSLGAGKAFEQYSADSVLQAVSAACADYRRLAKHAFAASQEWPRHAGVKRFVDALLA